MMIHVHIEDRQFNLLTELLFLNLQQATSLASSAEQQTKLLQQIHDLLAPAPPVKFEITLQGESMAQAKKFGKMKLDILDNGTAKATAAPVDSVGIATTMPAGSSTPVWTSSDAGVVVNADPSDATGLTAIFGPATPPALVNGFTVSVDSVLADGTTHVNGISEPCNIVAGVAGSFKVVVA